MYRLLQAQKIDHKNYYPLSLILEVLDQVDKAKIYANINIQEMQNLVHIINVY